MHRSELTVDLGAVRRNARSLLRVLDGVAALGGGEGGRLRARRGGRRRRGARRGRRRALRGDRAGGPGAAGRVLSRAHPRAWAPPRPAGRSPRLAPPIWSSRSWGDEIPEGLRVHLKLDTGMGRWGLSELPTPPADVVGLMSPPGHRRLRPDLRGPAGRALPEGDRALCRPDAAHRQQRRCAAASGCALRRRPLRGRAVRALAVRRATRPTTGSSRRSRGGATSPR